jgi:hypothetical protein
LAVQNGVGDLDSDGDDCSSTKKWFDFLLYFPCCSRGLMQQINFQRFQQRQLAGRLIKLIDHSNRNPLKYSILIKTHQSLTAIGSLQEF